MTRLPLLLFFIATLLALAQSIPTISITGSKFFTSEGKQFYIKGKSQYELSRQVLICVKALPTNSSKMILWSIQNNANLMPLLWQHLEPIQSASTMSMLQQIILVAWMLSPSEESISGLTSILSKLTSDLYISQIDLPIFTNLNRDQKVLVGPRTSLIVTELSWTISHNSIILLAIL